MSEENVVEEAQVVDDKLTEEAKAGKHPETVPWGQYVGVKESLGKKLDTATQKVGSLEEQLKGTTSAEELRKVTDELAEAKTNVQKATDELKDVKDKSVSEKRDTLIRRGVSKEKVDVMSEEQLNGAIGALADFVPKPDLASGAGATELKGSPMELARQAYSEGK